MSDFGQTTVASGGTGHGYGTRFHRTLRHARTEHVQKVAIGFSGDPMPCSMRSGAAVNRNS